MKAKMPIGQKPLETAVYLCTVCQAQITFISGTLRCSSCGTTKRSDFVPIYMENNPQEERLYTEDDFHGG